MTVGILLLAAAIGSSAYALTRLADALLELAAAQRQPRNATVRVDGSIPLHIASMPSEKSDA